MKELAPAPDEITEPTEPRSALLEQFIAKRACEMKLEPKSNDIEVRQRCPCVRHSEWCEP